MRIDLARALRDLTEIEHEVGEDKQKINPIIQELDKPEVATAILALILNEIRIFKTAQIQYHQTPDIYKVMSYDTVAGFAKLSAYVELLDIPSFIEARKHTPSNPNDEDRLPE